MSEHRADIDMEKEEIGISLGRLINGMWKSFLKLWWLVLILVLIGAGGVTLYQRVLKEPMYACTATFTVSTGSEESGKNTFYYDSTTAGQISMTFPYILESSFFQNTLLRQLGTDTLNGTITAETIEKSNVVTMRAESPSAEDARSILDAAIVVYPQTAKFVLGDIYFNMLNKPSIPTVPFNQIAIWKCIAYGGMGGLLISVCIIWVFAFFRRTVQSQEDMKAFTSLKCLAAVPTIPLKARKNKKNNGISVLDERQPYSYRESMRGLKVRLVRKMNEVGGKVLLITSTMPEEGKSLIAVNLARLLAVDGKKVLLVDGDLRNQKDAVLLGESGGYNLCNVAAGEKCPEELIDESQKNGIYYLGNAKSINQPASVLSSRAVKEFIEQIREKMDYVIIDSPPCGIFQDAGLLEEYSDCVLYVVKYDNVSGRQIRDGIVSLRGNQAVFVGYVFNKVPEVTGAYGYRHYGYGYKYGYGRAKYSDIKYGRHMSEENTDNTDRNKRKEGKEE